MASYDYTFVSGDTVTPTKLNDARTVGDIVNADVSATAAIAGTKVAPNFGSQNIQTTGNLAFGGTGSRITGDFTGVPVNDRLMLQTSTANSSSFVNVIPNGTGTTAGWYGYNNSNATNANFAGIDARSTEIRISSSITGTATHLPMTFHNGGSERMRIDASGNVGIGTTSAGQKLTVNGNVGLLGGVAVVLWNTANNAAPYIKSPAASAIAFYDTSDNERMRIDASGNVGIGTASPSYPLHVAGDINTSEQYLVDGTQVVGNRTTGWEAATGTATRTTFATSAVTTAQLAQRVKALIDDLTTHGLIGA
jgi:hypothetical protein